LFAIELCWNVYPAQPWSSALLFASHVLIFISFMVGPHAAPEPFEVKMKESANEDGDESEGDDEEEVEGDEHLIKKD
jgi:hypothetical protein